MRDYYKLLGVKKNAPEEEIREHWVQLMRKLHPDLRMEGAMEDERIKEINEAYQVLKHSSTRVEYDLKRAYDQEKSGSYFQKLSMPVSILIVLVILGTVYLKSPRVILQPSLTTLNGANQTNEINERNQRNQINQTDQIDQINQANQINQTNQINERNQRNEINQMNQINPIASTTRKRIVKMTVDQTNQIDQINQRNQIDSTSQRPSNSMTQLPFDLSPLTFDLTIDSSTQRHDHPVAVIDQTNQMNEINQRNQINQINQRNQKDQIDKKDERDQTDKIAASTRQRIDPSTPLIATEDEVRQFFANYTERYIQKDLDGFLSLFSPRAVQNRQDGLEGIRKIYGNFFKQSQEIEYRIDDIKIEIYQNAAEVKARYELVQLLKKSGEKKIWGGDIRWTLVKEGGALKILSLDYQSTKSY